MQALSRAPTIPVVVPFYDSHLKGLLNRRNLINCGNGTFVLLINERKMLHDAELPIRTPNINRMLSLEFYKFLKFKKKL